MSLGISENNFWEMNPRRINRYIEAYNIETKRNLEMSNVIAYLQGQYFVEALFCTVGNMFSSESSAKFEYPKKPYELGESKNSDTLDEEEIQRQRELVVARFMAMQSNFELTHSKG